MISKTSFTFLGLIISFSLISFTLPNGIQKKIDKEIKKTFDIKAFKIEPISVDASINQKLSKKIGPKNLFVIQKESTIIGYAYVDKAPSKTDEFDYLILLNKDLIVAKTKVLIYREDYGGEIGSKRWLRQFTGKTSSDILKYEKDIVAISGATISANSMTIAVNEFLQNLEILQTHKVL